MNITIAHAQVCAAQKRPSVRVLGFQVLLRGFCGTAPDSQQEVCQYEHWLSQPSNTIPGCGAQKIDSVFSAIQNEIRTIQKNSEEIRQNLDNIQMFLDII